MDELDEKILNLLREGVGIKPRVSKVAELLKENRSTVNLRIGKLEEEVIEGYEVDINWEKLGYELEGFIGIICFDEALKRLRKKLEEHDNVFQFWEISAGTFDLLSQVRFKSRGEIEKMHQEIRKISGVRDVDIWLVGPELKK